MYTKEVVVGNIGFQIQFTNLDESGGKQERKVCKDYNIVLLNGMPYIYIFLNNRQL